MCMRFFFFPFTLLRDIICMRVHVYISYVRIIYVILPKPSLRPPFCKFLRKSSDLARPQLQRFPRPRRPPISRMGNRARITTADTRARREREMRTSRLSIARSTLSFVARERRRCRRSLRFRGFLLLSVSSFGSKTIGRRADESHRAGQ